MTFELPDFGWDERPPEEPPDDERADLATAEQRRSVSVFQTMTAHEKLRLLSEKALAESLPWHLEQGAAYHVASYGDVDALTYFRHIAREQRIEYAILATWCMAQADADEIAKWVERGDVGRIDYVVGEVFQKPRPLQEDSRHP